MWRLWTRRCSMSQWSKFAFMCAGATMLDLTIRPFFLSVRVIGRWDKVHTKGSHFCAEVLTAPCGICQESGTWLLRRTCLQSCYGHCLQRWRRSICWWRVLILVIGQMYSVSRKRWRRATSRAIRLPGVLKIKGFEYKDQFAVEIFECQLHCSSEVAGLTRVACCVELLESEWLIGNFLKEISSFRWGCFLASDRIYVVNSLEQDGSIVKIASGPVSPKHNIPRDKMSSPEWDSSKLWLCIYIIHSTSLSKVTNNLALP